MTSFSKVENEGILEKNGLGVGVRTRDLRNEVAGVAV